MIQLVFSVRKCDSCGNKKTLLDAYDDNYRIIPRAPANCVKENSVLEQTTSVALKWEERDIQRSANKCIF